MEFNIGAVIGLFGGLLAGLLGWWYGRTKARENRGLDELYFHIWTKAKSYAWYATLTAIYLLFSLILLGINLHSAVILAILLLVHLASWAIAGAILFLRYTSHDLGG